MNFPEASAAPICRFGRSQGIVTDSDWCYNEVTGDTTEIPALSAQSKTL